MNDCYSCAHSKTDFTFEDGFFKGKLYCAWNCHPQPWEACVYYRKADCFKTNCACPICDEEEINKPKRLLMVM